VHDFKKHTIAISEVFRARDIVKSYLRPTSLTFYQGLSSAIGAEIFIKHENHNPTGTFKIRGGINLVHHLKQAGIGGVITFSTGNHGLSIATAARWLGVSATVVVPRNNNPVKNLAIRECGAELIEAGADFDEASATVKQICQERSLYYAHPCDEPLLINGVGTEFLEIVEDLPDIDVMIVPLGGGSEVAAAITTLRALRPEVEIIAVQAERSSAAYKSWIGKRICESPNGTFAGGFATGTAYETPFEIYKNALSDFVLLTEDEIYDAMGLACYYTHNFTEGAGAATIMAAIKLRDMLRGKKVVLQMSGANAAPQELVEAMRRKTFTSGFVA
jgi:threonine dehydratase